MYQDFREAQRFSCMVMVVVGGGGVIVFGLYSTVSVVSMSSAFNISSDISESCSAMYREHAV